MFLSVVGVLEGNRHVLSQGRDAFSAKWDSQLALFFYVSVTLYQQVSFTYL